MAGELLTLVLSWRTGLMVVFVFGFAPRFSLRLILRAFHRDDPRRDELVAEFFVVPRWERPIWVFQQLEVAIVEGLGGRLRWAATGRIIDRWHLGDGVKFNRDYPTTFEIPTDEDKAAIEPGDTVKAMFTMKDWGERMWLEVVEVKRRRYVCQLTSHPVGIPRLDFGKTLKIKPEHVIDILWHDVDYTEMDKAIAERLALYPSPFPPELADARCCGCPGCDARRARSLGA
jgi:hypothetical protein